MAAETDPDPGVNLSSAKANLLLCVAALIWGTAFVAQKIGMEAIGPCWYSALRFALGMMIVLPLLLHEKPSKKPASRDWLTGIAIGILLFAGINLQQFALLYTSLANTGFITGLYVVFVPIIGFFIGHRYGAGVWAGIALAVAGLYFLSIRGTDAGLNVNKGDLLTLVSAVIWSLHVISLSGFGHCLPPIRLAVMQFATCSLLSMLLALAVEPISWRAIQEAAIPLLYGGILSVGVGFTLQVIAQRHARAAYSAVILSSEAVIAAIAGWLVLNETLDGRALIGCALMMAGILLAQLAPQQAPAPLPSSPQHTKSA